MTVLLASIFLIIQTAMASPYQKQYGPKTGNIEAIVRISNSTSPDDLELLEGTILELGPYSCTVQSGRCLFKNILPRLHIASVLYDPKKNGVDFRFTGTQEGPLIKLKLSPKGTSLVTLKGESKIVYNFEKVIDPSVQMAEASNTESYYSTSSLVDSSLLAELWIKILDTGSDKPFIRKAFPGELDGIKLRLGDQVCIIRKGVCVFKIVRKGIYKISLVSLPPKLRPKQSNERLVIAKDTENVEIELDYWTKRPRPKDYGGDLRIILEKTVQN